MSKEVKVPLGPDLPSMVSPGSLFPCLALPTAALTCRWGRCKGVCEKDMLLPEEKPYSIYCCFLCVG